MYPKAVGLSQPCMGSFSWATTLPKHLKEENAYIYKNEKEFWYSIEVGEECPLSCKHCLWKKKPVGEGVPANILCEYLVEAAKEGFIPKLASISGKEPTVKPTETLQIARTLKEIGSKTVLMTSGAGLSYKLTKELAEYISYVDISIDGDKEEHELIRGRGTWEMAWRAFKNALAAEKLEKIAVLTTVSKLNLEAARKLIPIIKTQMLYDSRIVFTVGLYIGLPKDKFLLDLSDLLKLIETLAMAPVKSRILYLPCYSHYLPELFPKLGISISEAKSMEDLGNCVYPIGNTELIILSHMSRNINLLRLSSDGYIYLSCAHLLFPHPITSLGHLRDGIIGIVNAVQNNSLPKFLAPLIEPPKYCENLPCYSYCKGGERLIGAYLGTPGACDPYCPKLREGN